MKAVFFDLGGVVFEDPFSTNFATFVKALGLPTERIKEAYKQTDYPRYSEGSMSDKERWQLFIEALMLPPDTISTCITAYTACYNIIQPTIDFLRKIRQGRPDLPIGVISNQPLSIICRLRATYPQIFKLFDQKLTLVSAEVGLSKHMDNLKLYREAVRRAQVPPEEILFVDDSRIHLGNAAQVGMTGFWFDQSQPLPTLLQALQSELVGRR